MWIMSALGQKQTFAPQKAMSALPSKADICSAPAYVRSGPTIRLGLFECHLVSFALHPTLEDDSFAQQRPDFDRWRLAADIVRRFREAGISCELSDNLQTSNRRSCLLVDQKQGLERPLRAISAHCNLS